MTIIGKKFDVDFGPKALLEFRDETTLDFLITEMDGKKVHERETVKIEITQIRKQLFMVTWKERNGNTVTQIQDHKNKTVYMNWTWPDGNFIQAKGTISAV